MRFCGESMCEPYGISPTDSPSQPDRSSPGPTTPRSAPAPEHRDRLTDTSVAVAGVGPRCTEPGTYSSFADRGHGQGCAFPDSSSNPVGYPSNPFGSSQQHQQCLAAVRHIRSQQKGGPAQHIIASPHARQPAEAQPCTGPGHTTEEPNSAQMQDFTSAVAAAAAAGAMTALQQLPAAHLQTASGEQHKAFMNTARVAASAAAMHATSMLSPPFNTGNASPDQQQPECVPGKHTVHNSWRPSQPPNSSAAVNGRARQILDHPVAGNAARTKSDGSAMAHPGSVHGASRQVLQQSLLPDNRQQKSPVTGTMEGLPPDDAESLDMSERCDTRVSRSEKSLIKRLQLYAWVAGDQGRELLKQSFSAVADRHAAKATAADNGNAGGQPRHPAQEELPTGGTGPHQGLADQEGRRNMNTGTEAMPGGTDWGAYTDASSDIRQVCLEARAAEFQVPTARAQMSCKDETMPYVTQPCQPQEQRDATPRKVQPVAVDRASPNSTQPGPTGGDRCQGLKREPSRSEDEPHRCTAIRRMASTQQCTGENTEEGKSTENAPQLQPAVEADVNLDTYLAFDDGSGMMPDDAAMPADSFHSFFNDDLSKAGEIPSVMDDLPPAMEVDSVLGGRTKTKSPNVVLGDAWSSEGNPQQMNSVESIQRVTA